MEHINVRGRFALIFIVTALLVWAYSASGIKFGQDLKGGTTLVFSLDIDGAIESGRLPASVDRELFVTDTITVIDDRINKFGLAETTLTPVGEDGFEISLPAGAAGGVESIVDVVTALGNLQFRIEVLPDDQYSEPKGRKRFRIWPDTAEAFREFKELEVKRWQDARDAGVYYVPGERYYVAKVEGREGNEVSDFLVLEVPDEDHDFDGKILESPRVGRHPITGKPVVLFDVKIAYRNLFGEWTGENVKLPMAIVLNEEVTGGGRAPVIQEKLTDSVQISLGALNYEEGEKRAKELTTVLQTGSLKIRPTLERKNEIGASIAGEARTRGVWSVIVAFGLVLIFMIIYYRGAGLIADVALLLNLVLLVGFLAFFQATLTLPGIAGIVLTIGMAVDANILINERIREERRLGRTVRRALSEGYAKAISAIIDANVTSLITAVFLYWKGSGAIKGFAITLAIGLVVSMFTAIYVTRTIFEWRLSRGGLEKLGTLGSQLVPKVDWMGLRRLFAPLSVAGVVIGLLIFFTTDDYKLYDIDFTGGYKLQAAFKEETSVDDAKKTLAAAESKSFDLQLVDIDNNNITKTVEIGPFPAAQVLAVGGEGRSVEIKVQRLFEGTSTSSKESELSLAFELYIAELFEGRLLPRWNVVGPEPYVHSLDGDEMFAEFDNGLFTTVAFVDDDKVITEERLTRLLQNDFPFFTFQGSKRLRNDPASMAEFDRVLLVRHNNGVSVGQVNAFDVWIKSTRAGNPVERHPARMRQSLAEYLGSPGFRRAMAAEASLDEALLENVTLSTPFPSTNQIHSSVAQRLKNDAIVALFLAMIGIIIYIAIRFKSRAMGFAAVLCLFHDVAITLGIVAIANQLGLVDAKINLAMVAAFLTLVGYSVNDTVVIFDRIREERGKRPKITREIIDLSINLTLARTIRTSITFLLVCVALFVFNIGQRNVLEGFAFVLIVGSVVGTYSTIAIASPLLLYLPWLWERLKGFAPSGKMLSDTASNPLTLIFVPLVVAMWIVWASAFALFAFIAGLALFVPWALNPATIDETPETPTQMTPAT